MNPFGQESPRAARPPATASLPPEPPRSFCRRRASHLDLTRRCDSDRIRLPLVQRVVYERDEQPVLVQGCPWSSLHSGNHGSPVAQFSSGWPCPLSSRATERYGTPVTRGKLRGKSDLAKIERARKLRGNAALRTEAPNGASVLKTDRGTPSGVRIPPPPPYLVSWWYYVVLRVLERRQETRQVRQMSAASLGSAVRAPRSMHDGSRARDAGG